MPADPAVPADGPAESDASNELSLRLMRRVRTGDEDAFRELVELHQQSVIGTCARMLGHAGDAHDLAQQVFLRVWKAAPRYEPRSRFTTWLFTIVRHTVFNELRRRSRQATVSLDAPVNSPDGDAYTPSLHLTDPAAKPADHQALDRELEQAIDHAIAALPDQQRLAVTLRKFEDLPYEEMAVILNTSVPAVKSLLFRARTRLRISLREYLDS